MPPETMRMANHAKTQETRRGSHRASGHAYRCSAKTCCTRIADNKFVGHYKQHDTPFISTNPPYCPGHRRHRAGITRSIQQFFGGGCPKGATGAVWDSV